MGFLAGLLLVGAAEAATFRYEDETGTVHYTNIPSDPRYHILAPWTPRKSPQPSADAAVDPRQLTPPPGPARFAEAIQTAAERYGVDRRLVEAVIAVESAGNPGAVSRKGAQGLMQLMPQRSAELGVRNPFDPNQNLDGGVRHLRDLLQRFSGDVTLALAAYNAGEGAVRAYRGVPPFPETQDYVRRVRALYEGPGTIEDSPPPLVLATPQRVYRQESEDGTITFTNLPPRPALSLQRRF